MFTGKVSQIFSALTEDALDSLSILKTGDTASIVYQRVIKLPVQSIRRPAGFWLYVKNVCTSPSGITRKYSTERRKLAENLWTQTYTYLHIFSGDIWTVEVNVNLFTLRDLWNSSPGFGKEPQRILPFFEWIVYRLLHKWK